MLKDTLVIWGGEFGRTPFGQYRSGDPKKPTGRDHFGRAFSWIMAGGGVKPGSTYGESDEFGWNVTKDPRSCSRHAGHNLTPLRYRSRETDLSLSGATVPPVRCSRTCQKRYARPKYTKIIFLSPSYLD
jgi:hypothetical protein